MPDLTSVIGHAAYDTLRKFWHGSEATLVILNHARPGRRGYDAVVDVLTGWHLTKDNELKIVESETVTREILSAADTFGIYIPKISDPAKIWKLQSIDDARVAPTLANMRKWLFFLVPTGEVLER